MCTEPCPEDPSSIELTLSELGPYFYWAQTGVSLPLSTRSIKYQLNHKISIIIVRYVRIISSYNKSSTFKKHTKMFL